MNEQPNLNPFHYITEDAKTYPQFGQCTKKPQPQQNDEQSDSNKSSFVKAVTQYINALFLHYSKKNTPLQAYPEEAKFQSDTCGEEEYNYTNFNTVSGSCYPIPQCFVKSSGHKKKKVLNLENYISHLYSNGDFTECELIYFICLIEGFLSRMAQKADLNMKRIIAICLYTAQKVLRDENLWRIQEFSTLASIRASHVPVLELQFASFMDFDVLISEIDYSNMKKELLEIQALSSMVDEDGDGESVGNLQNQEGKKTL